MATPDPFAPLIAIRNAAEITGDMLGQSLHIRYGRWPAFESLCDLSLLYVLSCHIDVPITVAGSSLFVFDWCLTLADEVCCF